VSLLRAFSPGQVDWLPQFERSLGRSRDQLEARGFLVDAETRLGHAAELILQKASRDKPDLIVMGARGLRSTLSILLGGVAQHVIEHSSIPVLIVRAPYNGFKRILFAADGSPASLDAARYLAGFPLPENTEIHLFHVLPPLPVPLIMEPFAGTWETIYAPIPEPAIDEARQAKEVEAGEALLDAAAAIFKRQKRKLTRSLGRGDAASEIIEYAKNRHIGLIVVGSHGQGHFRTMRLGSVARKLIHYSDCSVLLVKKPPVKKPRQER
jgi:nucleotide-binding universal stress UspA family protein